MMVVLVMVSVGREGKERHVRCDSVVVVVMFICIDASGGECVGTAELIE